MLQQFQIIPDTYQEKTLEMEMYVIGYVRRDPCRVCVSKTLVSAVSNSPKDLRHLSKAFLGRDTAKKKYIYIM